MVSEVCGYRFCDVCGDGLGHGFTKCKLFCGPWREEGVEMVSVCLRGVSGSLPNRGLFD